MFHGSLLEILSFLAPGMSKPEVLKCPDGHFRHIIYGLGSYIADYPKQVLLMCIVQNWCPKYEASFLLIVYLMGLGNKVHSSLETSR